MTQPTTWGSLTPPSSVGGTYHRPKMPPGMPVTRLPAIRYHTVQGNAETLYGLAQELFGNPRQYVDIYNANRTGIIRKDNTPGFLDSIDAPLPMGAMLLLP